ncbi:MAG: hypothetical protein AAGA03_19105, partial [Planctomycetota bacterium]
HLTGTPINEETSMAIASLPWLRSLDLSGTNLDGSTLRQLDGLDKLQHVDVKQTNLQLSDLGRPAWANTVKLLLLPRPRRERTDELTMQGWPQLAELHVTRDGGRFNQEIVSLRLSDMPKLRVVVTNRIQNYAFYGKNLPRFERLTEYEDLERVAMRLMQGQRLPSGIWLSAMELDGAQTIERVECYCETLRTLKVEQCPNLKEVVLEPMLDSFGGIVSTRRNPQQGVQQWINALGIDQGPSRVSLGGVDLRGIDLSPLSKNRRLRVLELSATGIDYQQLKAVSPLPALRRISIQGCEIDSAGLEWMLSEAPTLQRITADLRSIERIDIEGRTQFDSLSSEPLERIQHLRLVDLPRLKSELHLKSTPDLLEIRDVPQLTGITMEAPWPKNCTLKGLRQLRAFNAGGASVDDTVLESIQPCANLDRLTLAYAPVSPEALKQLRRFGRLSYLAVPGCQVNDDVTASWRGLRALRTLNLDDTAVSLETIAWLSQLPSLRSLSLARVPLDEPSLRALGELTQLHQLSLADNQLPVSALRPILESELLEDLDLRGWQVDQALIDLLCRCHSLERLTMPADAAKLPWIEQLMGEMPSIRLDLGSGLAKLPESIQRQMYNLNRMANVAGTAYRIPWARTDEEPPEATAEKETSPFAGIQRVGVVDPSVYRDMK